MSHSCSPQELLHMHFKMKTWVQNGTGEVQEDVLGGWTHTSIYKYSDKEKKSRK